eukprot:gene10059-2482_t
MMQQSKITVAETFNKDDSSSENIRRKFKAFLRNYQTEDGYIYREDLKTNFGLNTFNIRIEDMNSFDEKLTTLFSEDPNRILPELEKGAQDAAESLSLPLKNIQLSFTWNSKPMGIRDLSSNHVSKLITLTGIVIKASRTQSKATNIYLRCSTCHDEKVIPISAGFTGIQIPQKCDSIKITNTNEKQKECPNDPYTIIADKCQFIDQQTLKLQELPENVPTGEMPRSLILTIDGHLVEKASPGSRIEIVGIYSTFQGQGKKKDKASVSLRYPYVRVIGIQSTDIDSSLGRNILHFTKEEETKIIQRSNDPNIYETIARNIDPAIFGLDDIKKAIACELFGGSRKILQDGTKRRGDINILLLGDPSTAKSQLLKFVEKVAPIGVYTSGKGSSAAGLTASIIKEPGTGDYYLEGGSMVLADSGIVCIDEFDKMRAQDRVAIHEAMEQQTISIAKAGITTVLNSRTSVLAAANPIFGRYDDMRSPEEQIDFQTTILSRFDMIFIVRDLKDSENDERLARHVLNVHKSGTTTNKEGDISLEDLKRYIAYCRMKVSPRISEEAAETLKNYYVKQRYLNREGSKSIPITVRQLEALIRISESLARMRLAQEATKTDAEEAIRLFTSSTVQAIKSNVNHISLSDKATKDLQIIEEEIKKRLPIQSTTNQDSLLTLLEKQGFERNLSEKAIYIMCQRKELEYRHQRKCVFRKR